MTLPYPLRTIQTCVRDTERKGVLLIDLYLIKCIKIFNYIVILFYTLLIDLYVIWGILGISLREI